MTTSEFLADMYQEQRGNTILRAMLIDCLMEERDMTRSEAERHASAIEIAGAEAHLVSKATALLAVGTPTARWVQKYLCHETGVPKGSALTVWVVTGARLEAVWMGSHCAYARYWGYWQVTVGADRLIIARAEYLARRRASYKARVRRGKPS